ncbi:hypothetical protein GCM10011346_46530 [Oceanobacillus neutriphilus]|uniref:Uncharacterized protein n=1 Tax=Oceanobacillus neutriphilus TaxID=531815 RepID=A0ABQ2P1P3_9BACI|nr:hypothetical protein GCM10011346_46530 [Oceanobacillus neutriphilus]
MPRDSKMNYVKFLICEIILFGLLIIVNYFFDGYIQHPFTEVDLIAIIIFFPIIGFILFSFTKLFKKFHTIPFRNKIILSIPAFIVIVIAIGIILSSFGIQ